MDNLEKFPDQIREICTRYFAPRSNDEASPLVKLEASHTIECMVAVVCMFKSLDTCNFSLVCNSFINLLWGLERNQFWKKYAGELLPIIKSGFASYVTAVKLMQQPNPSDEVKLLILRYGRAWMQVLPAAIGCLYNHNRMLEDSNALLIELDKAV